MHRNFEAEVVFVQETKVPREALTANVMVQGLNSDFSTCTFLSFSRLVFFLHSFEEQSGGLCCFVFFHVLSPCCPFQYLLRNILFYCSSAFVIFDCGKCERWSIFEICIMLYILFAAVHYQSC